MKIGILTMHRVKNYGSILQTYALQKKLNEIGVDNEIIDYLYPSKQNKTFKQKLQYIKHIILDVIYGFPNKKKKKRFEKFYKDNLKVSHIVYDRKSIFENPPVFDLYLLGSDQVWNPTFIKDDTAFLLSFVPNDKTRAAYASSFAMPEIPKEYVDLYKKELTKFQNISVREKSGISIIKKLTKKNAQFVCDPTMLLDKNEWGKLAENSKICINEKYILVYALSYMYNPFPKIYNIIDSISEKFNNIKVIYLDGSKHDLLRKNSKVIKNAGPNEFLYLFKNAEFVITTSFHGTAFSIIFGKPFYSVVKRINSKDDRMPSLLKELNCTSSIINYDSVELKTKEELLLQKCNDNNLKRFKNHSFKILSEFINDKKY